MPHSDVYKKISDYLPDDFSISLLKNSTQILKDKKNELRIHFFAMGIRELISYFLHTMAPDLNVLGCLWFKPETDNGKPTRKQRMRYIIHGGLDPKFIEKNLAISSDEINQILKNLGEEHDKLSRLIHIRPDTTETDEAKISNKVDQCLGELLSFLQMIFSFKHEINSHLESEIFDKVTQKFIEENFDDIDILATHYWTEQIEIESQTVKYISDQEILLEIDGNIVVGLQWGSDSDVRNDIGARSEDSFPFTCTVSSSIKNPSLLKISRENIKIDTSSWYE